MLKKFVLWLMLFCGLCLFSVQGVYASMTTEMVLTLVGNAVDVGADTVEGTMFVLGAITDPDGASAIRILGAKASPTSYSLQKGFGSFDSVPFMFNAGLITEDPAKNRLTVGIGSRVGSYRDVAVAYLYVNVVPDEISEVTIPYLPSNLGISLAVGVDFVALSNRL